MVGARSVADCIANGSATSSGQNHGNTCRHQEPGKTPPLLPASGSRASGDGRGRGGVWATVGAGRRNSAVLGNASVGCDGAWRHGRSWNLNRGRGCHGRPGNLSRGRIRSARSRPAALLPAIPLPAAVVVVIYILPGHLVSSINRAPLMNRSTQRLLAGPRLKERLKAAVFHADVRGAPRLLGLGSQLEYSLRPA